MHTWHAFCFTLINWVQFDFKLIRIDKADLNLTGFVVRDET